MMPTASGAPVAQGQGVLQVVSIKPCVDAVLVQVANHAQIAGISHYSQDPRATSIPLALAGRFHATSGTAEEVVALKPDPVLSGPHVAPPRRSPAARGISQHERQLWLRKWDVLPLEYLIAKPPRVLLSPVAAAAGEDRAAAHPALRRLAGYIAIRLYEDRLMNCGGQTGFRRHSPAARCASR